MKRNDHEKVVFESEDYSRKGREIAENPNVAITLYWREVHRQVTVTGRASPLPDETSDEMWKGRARPNQAASVATREGATIASIDEELELHAKVDAVAAEEGEISRPATYRAYGLFPTSVEFWEGSEARLHRRVFYEKNASGQWAWRRLQP